MTRDVEDGHTRINNEILEALARVKLSGREHQAIWFLLRKTYGYQKANDAISLSQWEEGTGINRRHLKPLLEKLRQKGIITIESGTAGRGNSSVYAFNKYYEKWGEKVPDSVPNKKVPFSGKKGTVFGQKKVPNPVLTK